MVDYTIYVLDESDVTFTAGGPLDGVNQGSGVHLTNQLTTFVIDTPAWTPIEVTDNDLNFQDSDSSQTLNGAQEIDGTTYTSGSVVEAEYGFEVEDEDGNVWQLIAFNVREPGAANSYGTVEGIAVIGGPGDFPPTGQTLTVITSQEGPNYAAADYATPICFDAGCPILTPSGYVPVEQLKAGDAVMTADRGAQPVVWTGSRKAFGIGPFAPVEIAAGALGNATTIRVSQQHRILVSGAQAQLLFGEDEVLVPARSLVDGAAIRLVPGVRVHFHHILLPQHAVLDCAGMATESFLPSAFGLSQLSEASRNDLQAILPALTPYRPARLILRAYEAALLAA